MTTPSGSRVRELCQPPCMDYRSSVTGLFKMITALSDDERLDVLAQFALLHPETFERELRYLSDDRARRPVTS